MGKKTIITLIILPLLFVAGFIVYGLTNGKFMGDKTIPRPIIGSPAPNFTFPDMDGKKVSLADFKGKVVFMNVWATWCPTCREEMPIIHRLYKRFEDDKRFQVLTVSIDVLGKEAVVPFYKEMGFSLPTLLDTKSKIKSIYGISGVPESFIIDKNGKIVFVALGPREWDSAEYISVIENLMSAS